MSEVNEAVQRLTQLLQILRRLPQDLEILIDMAEENPELMETLRTATLEIMRMEAGVISRMAMILARKTMTYGAESGTG